MTGKPKYTASKGRNSAARPNYCNNYRLKSEVSIRLRCQLCSTRYTALQIKNCSKSTPAVKVATMKNMDDFCYKVKLSRATAKLNGTQRRTLVSL